MTTKYFNVKNGLTAGEKITLDADTGNVSAGNIVVTGISNLGNVGNVKIAGGHPGQFLTTDGSGNLTFESGGAVSDPAPMPIFVDAGETLYISNNHQGLFSIPITVDGTLEIDGALVAVDGATIVGNGAIAVPSLTATGNVSGNYIFGNGYYLTGIGNGGGGGNALPGGANTQIQFNDSNTFGGSANFTFNKSTNLLSISGNVQAGNLRTAGAISASGNANVGNIGAVNGVFTNVSGNGFTLSSIAGANVTGAVANALISGTVYASNQPNITSLGTLSSLSVTGNSNVGNLSAGTLVATTANISGNLTVADKTNLGNVENVTINGGANGYVLSTDGAGNLSWAQQTGSGAASIQILDDGTTLTNAVTSINFVGSGVTATATGNAVTVTVTSGGNATMPDILSPFLLMGA